MAEFSLDPITHYLELNLPIAIHCKYEVLYVAEGPRTIVAYKVLEIA